MKLTWKNHNKKRPHLSYNPNLPFDHEDHSTEPTCERPNGVDARPDDGVRRQKIANGGDDDETSKLSEAFQAEGNNLAEEGNYREALRKWEAALTLTPQKAVLHEQKAQVLLEIGEAWDALKAAIRTIELEPSWAEQNCRRWVIAFVMLEAWITLGRAQLNFGEPDSAIESFDRALAIKPDSVEAQGDRQIALQLVKRRKQLHLSGLTANKNRYDVGDKTENS